MEESCSVSQTTFAICASFFPASPTVLGLVTNLAALFSFSFKVKTHGKNMFYNNETIKNCKYFTCSINTVEDSCT